MPPRTARGSMVTHASDKNRFRDTTNSLSEISDLMGSFGNSTSTHQVSMNYQLYDMPLIIKEYFSSINKHVRVSSTLFVLLLYISATAFNCYHSTFTGFKRLSLYGRGLTDSDWGNVVDCMIQYSGNIDWL